MTAEALATDETLLILKIAFLASDSPEAKEALSKLVKRYGNADSESADAVVALVEHGENGIDAE